MNTSANAVGSTYPDNAVLQPQPSSTDSTAPGELPSGRLEEHEARLTALERQVHGNYQQVGEQYERLLALMSQLMEKSFSNSEAANKSVSDQFRTILEQWNPMVLFTAIAALVTTILATVLGCGGK